jgi:hypothetical protein
MTRGHQAFPRVVPPWTRLAFAKYGLELSLPGGIPFSNDGTSTMNIMFETTIQNGYLTSHKLHQIDE